MVEKGMGWVVRLVLLMSPLPLLLAERDAQAEGLIGTDTLDTSRSVSTTAQCNPHGTYVDTLGSGCRAK